MHILLIDDDETNARYLQSLITKVIQSPIEFDVCRVDRLFEGLKRLDDAQTEFHAILLDLGLPECGGLMTLKLVRAHAPNIPVVVVTALDSTEIAMGAIEAGAHDYLIKGKFSALRLEQALVDAVGKTRVQADQPELKGTFLSNNMP